MDADAMYEVDQPGDGGYSVTALTALPTEFGATWKITKRPDGGLAAVPRPPGGHEPVTAATPAAMRALLAGDSAVRPARSAAGSGG